MIDLSLRIDFELFKLLGTEYAHVMTFRAQRWFNSRIDTLTEIGICSFAQIVFIEFHETLKRYFKHQLEKARESKQHKLQVVFIHSVENIYEHRHACVALNSAGML